MDKLTKSQQNAIKKLSDLKITEKLLEAGVEEQVVTQMDRNALMNAWAEIVVRKRGNRLSHYLTAPSVFIVLFFLPLP